MSTSPEEVINKQIWEILQDVKEESLVTEQGRPVEYRIPNVVGVGIIPPRRRERILRILEEQEAWKLRQVYENVFSLDLNHLKFEEIYSKYQKACDLNSHLEDFQESLINGKKQPEFLHVSNEKNLHGTPAHRPIHKTGSTEYDPTDSQWEKYYEPEKSLGRMEVVINE